MAKTHEIAEWLDVPAEGVADAEIERVAAPESAGPDAVVFATSAAALTDALASTAGLVLVNTKIAADKNNSRMLRVPDARLAFAIVADRLRPREVAEIDPTASVADTATIAEGVSIGPGSVIGRGVCVGRESRIGARVVIEDGVVLGERVQVQAGVVLGARGFGYARRPDGSYLLFPQQGALVIEDDVEIGANSTIDRGALGETRIGAGTKIDNLVHIGHNVRLGRNVIIAAQTGISGSSVVEDGAILGGQVGMGEHAIVGPGVILGGGAGVLSNKKLYGAGQVFWGRPARPLKQYLRDLARLSRGN
ncbi:UDP-3-O-(3-hydroxymyristoyl) glucosamine N-acyltransferase [Terriglobus roseus DSM 18391]|uniref:UDP-3-O-(3-hydroxymyristoyl) glucosamine N-acyltransferase n=1 Tax=Terriglobus roseus (strain DSM 18391 / NRRL B-41598 / KBS 63) TaxID=926566 RepID=I3ZIB1_TERRK|nr:UDP-3-O-(3-hydroxymyristoyl)glucosamine N-acyltransferase [Terriglobus roseus]AFL88979.1 UDP-3-O-(3-hydroxymyristoyl) glucosamine N-acyltransferase [Terriglobus roseus DSM 18391]